MTKRIIGFLLLTVMLAMPMLSVKASEPFIGEVSSEIFGNTSYSNFPGFSGVLNTSNKSIGVNGTIDTSSVFNDNGVCKANFTFNQDGTGTITSTNAGTTGTFESKKENYTGTFSVTGVDTNLVHEDNGTLRYWRDDKFGFVTTASLSGSISFGGGGVIIRLPSIREYSIESLGNGNYIFHSVAKNLAVGSKNSKIKFGSTIHEMENADWQDYAEIMPFHATGNTVFVWFRNGQSTGKYIAIDLVTGQLIK